MITRNRYVFRNLQISKKVDAKNYLIFKYVVENTRLKKIIPNFYRQTNFFFRDRAERRELNLDRKSMERVIVVCIPLKRQILVPGVIVASCFCVQNERAQRLTKTSGRLLVGT